MNNQLREDIGDASGLNGPRISPMAMRLWTLMLERGASYTLNEIRRDIGAPSKAAFERAYGELEDAGLISSEVEE